MFRKLAAPLLVVVVAALGSGPAATQDSSASKVRRLHTFRSCGELLDYVKGNAARIATPYGLPGQGPIAAPGIPVPVGAQPPGSSGPVPSTAPTRAAAPESDFSTTNVQEEGADEPDIVKSNGSQLFALANGKLQAVDVRSDRPRLLGSLDLPEENRAPESMLLVGKRLLIFGHAAFEVEPLPVPTPAPTPPPSPSPTPAPAPAPPGASSSLPAYVQGSTVTEIDVSDPDKMRIVRTLELEGSYVSARLVGGSVRVVVSSPGSRGLPLVGPGWPNAPTLAAATERNRAVIRSSTLANWIPSRVVENKRRKTRTKRALVQCRHVRRPAVFSGLGMLTVLTIDLDKGLQPVDSDAVLSDGQIVYASERNLYVATQRWAGRPDPDDPSSGDNKIATAIHRFDVSLSDTTQYRGSGEVSGHLLSQWSLSEHKGMLRVASTEMPTWWNPGPREESESFVTVLDLEPGRLAQVGRVGGLGKGERIFAVRFIDDVGYVVTFRQVDPLYTVDVSDPKNPRVLGELKILGYSAYLHPIGEDLLLGVGQDADEQGGILGTQLSVFDVSDLRRPDRLHRKTIESSESEVEHDHHAFLYWGPARLAVVPVQSYVDGFGGVVAFRVGRQSGLDELGRVSHGSGNGSSTKGWSRPMPIRRSLVVGDSLFTVSELGVRASSMRTLDSQGWVGFN